MGNTIWLDLSDGETERGGWPDNTFLLKYEKPLERISERLSLTKLTVFYDHSVLVEEFGEELGHLEVTPVWSDIADGLRTFHGLREALEAQPDLLPANLSSSQSHWPAGLMRELARCESELQSAAGSKTRFRVLLVP